MSGEVPDSHVWLEEIDSPAVLEWVKAHNDRTLSILKGDERYLKTAAEIQKILLATDRIPTPDYHDGSVYNFWQDAEHVRGVWRRTTLESFKTEFPQWETVLDLDALAADENENWVWKGIKRLPGSTRCVVWLSRGGKDASVVREFDWSTKEFVKGGFELSEARSFVSWWDADTLLVASDFGAGSLTNSGYPRLIKVWRRGTLLQDAPIVFEGSQSDVLVAPEVSHSKDCRVAIAIRALSFYSSEAHVFSDDLKTRKLDLPQDIDFRDIHKGRLLAKLRSDWAHSSGLRFRAGSLVALRLDAMNLEPELLYEPNPRSSIAGWARTRNCIYVNILQNVCSRVLKFRLGEDDRWTSAALALPKDGNVLLLSADPNEDVLFFQYESFLTPTQLMMVRDDLTAIETLKCLPERFDASGIIVEQLETKSADGTRVPYFLVRKKDLVFDGENPTLLYGYGGFETSMRPSYLGPIGKAWIENGGVYALANIRGGGEFGPSWHQAALGVNRQRSFDDFIAVAQDLTARGVSSPRRLAIQGGSNGGLLVGAVFVQRPELFNGVICQVPLLDMLRYQFLLAGHSWIGEYGDAEKPELREAILRYSPYQNVRAEGKYPEVFFITSTKDDRVHPAHARKMVARMKEQGHPVLYFENIEGGHGVAANLEQRVQRLALEFTYLYQKLMD